MTIEDKTVESGLVRPAPAYKSAFPKKVARLLPIVENGCFIDLSDFCWVISWLDLFFSIALTLSPFCPFYMYFCALFFTDSRSGWFPATGVSMTLLPIVYGVNIWACSFFIKGSGANKPDMMVHYVRMWVVRVLYNLFPTAIFTRLFSNITATPGVVAFFLCLGFIIVLPLYFMVCAHSLHVKMIQELKESEPSVAYGAAAE